jgi:DNA-binding response OmpR family regulator
MTSVLVVDDDKPLRQFVARNLEARDFDVAQAANGMEALAQARHLNPDLIILDIMMPHLDGYETCRRLRSFTDVPVIVLTAMADEQDIVAALDSGADDCLTKPFGVEELLARIRSVMRRAARSGVEAGGDLEVHYRDLRIDLEGHRVWKDDAEVSLTRTEFGVLRYYAQNLNKTVPHELVLAAVWGDGFKSSSHYVRIYVSRLRSKLEADGDEPYFTTEHGLGYRFGH